MKTQTTTNTIETNKKTQQKTNTQNDNLKLADQFINDLKI